MNPPCSSICDGCKSVIGHGRPVNVLGVLWHPECFCCNACRKPIAIDEVENHVSNSRGKFHKSCYREHCYVCKDNTPSTAEGIEYNEHLFWLEKYCASHEIDGTAKCCSCERLEPRGTNYVMLDDGRWLCLECKKSAVMDTHECQPLYFEIREFFEALNMKIEKEFPLALVEKQALNEAEKQEKIGHHHEVLTTGVCISEETTTINITRTPKRRPNNLLIGIVTESQMGVRECEVIAVLILYGLPRLVTGSILAYEMMHAWLRINGYRNIEPQLEEGICQVLAHMWLESQTYALINGAAASSSASSSHTQVNTTHQPMQSDFEKKLVEFCKNHIDKGDSPVYGLGFLKVNEMVTNSSLHETLREIQRRLKAKRNSYL